MTCPKIEICNKKKTQDFFRLTCMDDHEICPVFNGAIDLGSENRHPRDWMNPPKKWWLISDGDIQAIKAGLTGEILHTLESGLHITDAIPTDYQGLETRTN